MPLTTLSVCLHCTTSYAANSFKVIWNTARLLVADNAQHDTSPADGSMYSAVSLLVHHFKYMAGDFFNCEFRSWQDY